jgi:hypothetical protein
MRGIFSRITFTESPREYNSLGTSEKMIQKARSKLSESDRSECINLNRLWLEVGVSYSSILEYESTAAINSAGPESSRRIGNWRQSVLPVPLPAGSLAGLPAGSLAGLSAVFLAEWNSVMVEPVRHVLQRWRGVCSFSQTMRSTRSDEESHLVNDLRSKNNVGLPTRRLFGGPARLLSGRENDLLRSYSKALKYDDISIT